MTFWISVPLQGNVNNDDFLWMNYSGSSGWISVPLRGNVNNDCDDEALLREEPHVSVPLRGNVNNDG